jgi:hypothetical protein
MLRQDVRGPTLADFKRVAELNRNVILRCRVCGAAMKEHSPCPVDPLHLLQPYRSNYVPYPGEG